MRYSMHLLSAHPHPASFSTLFRAVFLAHIRIVAACWSRATMEATVMTTAPSAVVPDAGRGDPAVARRTQHHRGRVRAAFLAALGRVPSLTELGIYSVMWSEHCSYKSSRVHLKRLPTRSERVVQGPGENAGIIDVGDGWACAFKIESHNHPSYIEPFQGAATGVGGILRDIFTMGARPLAVMDSLRFGPIADEPAQDARRARSSSHKNHSIVEGVVSGIAGYGNCFGVPNLGGETKFEPCYSGNPLVNAFALGLVRIDEIFYGQGHRHRQSGDLCRRKDRPRRHSRRNHGQRRV